MFFMGLICVFMVGVWMRIWRVYFICRILLRVFWVLVFLMRILVRVMVLVV